MKNNLINIDIFECKFLDAKSESPTSIFGDYISIHLVTNKKPLIILIKNEKMAQTYKN